MGLRSAVQHGLGQRRTLAGLLAVVAVLGAGALLWRRWAGAEAVTILVDPAQAQESNPHAGALVNPDGTWKYTNALARETSPYLLLHAHNPVDWYPWGPEALAKARAEDRPIFLSVGYSTCYWCHVMERQVFSDPAIAGMMNEWFVSIKVDREERPDLDDIYMAATQLLTGGGGWPNSVFLTPQLEPFYAGTYFPPVSQFGRPGFPEVLQSLHQAWTERRAEVEQQADRLTAAIRQAQEAQDARGDAAALTQGLIAAAVGQLQDRFDETYAGFGGAPKFPPDMDLELLMAEYERTGDALLLRPVTRTLEEMARGGLRDHLGGGFHRYATDRRWRVPHFEKMLYNQAALAIAYLHAYQLTQAAEYRDAARGIFAFVQGVMTDPQGGFYSALDSETDGVEGRYYLWTRQEIRQALGTDADAFLAAYDLAPMPEGDGGVLHMPRSLAEAAAAQGVTAADLDRRLAPLRLRLLQVRQQRPRPLLDTKVLSGWSGLMIDAYAYGYRVLGHEEYLTAARRAAAFVLKSLRDEEGRLQRSYRDGTVKVDAFQEDYAFLARGLLGLYRATGEQTYLRQAEELVAQMERLFWDEANGGYFLTDRSEQLIAQTKSPYDGAVASGNSEAAHVLASLAALTGQEAYRQRARQTLQAFAGAMGRGGGFARMLLALHLYLNPGTAGPVLNAATAAAPAATPPRLADLLSGLDRPGGRSELLPTDSGSHVQAEPLVSVERLVPGLTFQVAARLQVATGWHINANPASYDFLIPTTLRVESDLPVEVVSVDYPLAGIFRPTFAGDSLAVYSGQVVVRATLRLSAGVAPGVTGTLALRLRYQACDDKQCLAPTEVSLPVDVAVASDGHPPVRQHPEVFGEE